MIVRNNLSCAEAGVAVRYIMKCEGTLSPGPLKSLWWCYISTFFVLVMCRFLTRPWHAAINLVLCLFYVYLATGQMVSALYTSSVWYRVWPGCSKSPVRYLSFHMLYFLLCIPVHSALVTSAKIKPRNFCMLQAACRAGDWAQMSVGLLLSLEDSVTTVFVGQDRVLWKIPFKCLVHDPVMN